MRSMPQFPRLTFLVDIPHLDKSRMSREFDRRKQIEAAALITLKASLRPKPRFCSLLPLASSPGAHAQDCLK
jgi:hypothetical protein